MLHFLYFAATNVKPIRIPYARTLERPTVDLPDPHSFIIRFWPEEIDAGSGKIKWRGHITHVTSNRRRYIEKLQEINDFIVTYLADLDADITVP